MKMRNVFSDLIPRNNVTVSHCDSMSISITAKSKITSRHFDILITEIDFILVLTILTLIAFRLIFFTSSFKQFFIIITFFQLTIFHIIILIQKNCFLKSLYTTKTLFKI